MVSYRKRLANKEMEKKFASAPSKTMLHSFAPVVHKWMP